jgi:hypothetical protein
LVDQHSLRRLAADGVAAFPPSGLTTLADWCWDYGEATGDARYCSLWRTFTAIAAAFEDLEAVDSSAVTRIDHLLRSEIPEILDAPDAAEAAGIARRLREGVQEP